MFNKFIKTKMINLSTCHRKLALCTLRQSYIYSDREYKVCCKQRHSIQLHRVLTHKKACSKSPLLQDGEIEASVLKGFCKESEVGFIIGITLLPFLSRSVLKTKLMYRFFHSLMRIESMQVFSLYIYCITLSSISLEQYFRNKNGL